MKESSLSSYKELPISQMVSADWNYKDENEELTTKLVQNIKRNGQIENILVRDISEGRKKRFEVVNGNHRLEAMQILKKKTIVCYDLGKISLADAKRIAIETNETRFETDYGKLAELLSDISQEYSPAELAETMPYDQQQIIDNIEMVNYDPGIDSSESSSSSGGEPMDASITIIYGFEDEAVRAEISEILKRYPSARIK